MPPMPIDIAAHLLNIAAGDVPDNLQKKIEWIAYNLSSQTMYPNKLCNVAARSLVNLYPALRDTSEPGHVDCHSWAEWAGVTKCMPTSLSRGPPLPSQPQRRLHGDGEEGSPLFSSLPHQWVTWVTGA
ncbi:uncharacterized protein [Dermacentor andersoni]|uniref:uncharacterized protein n=1 Tax=Dermacentor andersoni TaxID=34620 RepID=UPI002417320F|nr:uncharacterized protein LOC126538755 isoform X1 [Dermacentor andersoni]